MQAQIYDAEHVHQPDNAPDGAHRWWQQSQGKLTRELAAQHARQEGTSSPSSSAARGTESRSRMAGRPREDGTRPEAQPIRELEDETPYGTATGSSGGPRSGSPQNVRFRALEERMRTLERGGVGSSPQNMLGPPLADSQLRYHHEDAAGVGPLEGDEDFRIERQLPPQTEELSTDAAANVLNGGVPDPYLDRVDSEVFYEDPLDRVDGSAAKPALDMDDGVVKPSRTQVFLERMAKAGPARCPACCVCSGLLVVCGIIGAGMALMPPELETNFDSFLKTDVEASVQRDAFVASLATRAEQGRRLQASNASLEPASRDELQAADPRELQWGGVLLYTQFDLEIVYELQGDSGRNNILHEDILSEVQRFEERLRNLPAWQAYCGSTASEYGIFCDPGLSFVNFAMPSATVRSGDVVPSELMFDGDGRDSVQLPLDIAFQLIQERDFTQLFLPVDFEPQSRSTRTIRSFFRFRFECCFTGEPSSQRTQKINDLKATWATFAKETVIPTLQDAARGVLFGEDKDDDDVDWWSWPLNVYYDGNSFEEIETMMAIIQDSFLAIGAMLFVLLYIFFHTRSIFLSLSSAFICILSVPLSYVGFAILSTIISGSSKLGIASVMSIFLIVGLGADVIFVYTDFWNLSKAYVDEQFYVGRIAFTWRHAGKASLVTSATTAVSFLANLASVLKPLREFGYFMGLCVMLVWVLITLLYVPLCIIDETYLARCRGDCIVRFASEQVRRFGVYWHFMDHSGKCRCGSTNVETYALGLHRWRRSTCAMWAFLSLCMVIWAGIQLEVDTGVPAIFPEDHNQVRGKEVMSAFRAKDSAIPILASPPHITSSVCNEHSFGANDQRCTLFWCEALVNELPAAGQCACHHRFDQCDTQGTTAYTTQRFVLEEGMDHAAILEDVTLFLGDGAGGRAADRNLAFRPGSLQSRSLPPLLMQEWETGEVQIGSMFEVTSLFDRSSGDDTACGWQELCFCSSYKCETETAAGGANLWTDQSTWLTVPETGPGRRLAQSESSQWTAARPLPGEEEEAAPAAATTFGVWSRALSSGNTVATNTLNVVDVVFGMSVTLQYTLLGEVDPDSLWHFDTEHDISQPWAQRNLISFCQDLPDNLRVVLAGPARPRCWIQDFKQWAKGRGERFPVKSDRFHYMAVDFATSALVGSTSGGEYMWIRDGQVKASFLAFSTYVTRVAAIEVALESKQTWDAYVDYYNTFVASPFAQGAWHTSPLWVRSQAQEALVSSTLATLAIAICLAFVGMLIFTRDWVLSFLVVVSTLGVVVGLAWFIIVAMNWLIGPIEVLGLIVFIGYAVTYSLHVAHRYGSHDAEEEQWGEGYGFDGLTGTRLKRVTSALRSMGPAIIGSAVTTTGCSIFLLFCQLVICRRLGGVVLAVTIFSIVTAVALLPTVLLLIGPANPGRRLFMKAEEAFEVMVNAWRWMSNVPSHTSRARNYIADIATKAREPRGDGGTPQPATSLAGGPPAAEAQPRPPEVGRDAGQTQSERGALAAAALTGGIPEIHGDAAMRGPGVTAAAPTVAAPAPPKGGRAVAAAAAPPLRLPPSMPVPAERMGPGPGASTSGTFNEREMIPLVDGGGQPPPRPVRI